MIAVGIVWLVWGALHPRYAGVWFALGVVFLLMGVRKRRQGNAERSSPA